MIYFFLKLERIKRKFKKALAIDQKESGGSNLMPSTNQVWMEDMYILEVRNHFKTLGWTDHPIFTIRTNLEREMAISESRKVRRRDWIIPQ